MILTCYMLIGVTSRRTRMAGFHVTSPCHTSASTDLISVRMPTNRPRLDSLARLETRIHIYIPTPYLFNPMTEVTEDNYPSHLIALKDRRAREHAKELELNTGSLFPPVSFRRPGRVAALMHAAVARTRPFPPPPFSRTPRPWLIQYRSVPDIPSACLFLLSCFVSKQSVSSF